MNKSDFRKIVGELLAAAEVFEFDWTHGPYGDGEAGDRDNYGIM